MQRYAITDRKLCAAGLHAQVARWVAAGVEWVQLREKDLSLSGIEELSRSLALLTRGTGTRLLVNGLPPETARACGADGVHLRGGALSEPIMAAAAHGRVTVSCHTLADVRQALGADAVLWGPVFGKVIGNRQVMPGTGLPALAEACALAGRTPVFALGGVTAQNAQACMEAGAAGVAGIRLFLDREL